ncbi:hypothetical protein [Globicatella sp. PHS-GS-PNBC-21-1553]|uniref:hypothetical protein n=1 Tax=Globicatella sp. PHS-GS-PNBC-21-1553 TaxID=2885764 RepID=UPI00298F2BA1|nr:hypothetical protein [Globicatella sp. PHS-GS-PNBC-21-1553]WPC07834.1 ABC transporter permease [Globicatella sp. PHS-GS-PNBC-21-1553]
MRIIQNEFIKNKTITTYIIDFLVPVITCALLKYFVIDFSVEYSDLTPSTYWYVTFSMIYLLMILPIQIVYQNLRESLIEDNNSGWDMMLQMNVKISKVIRVKFLINIMRCFIVYIVYTLICLFILNEKGLASLINLIILPSMWSFIMFLPVALLLQMICLTFDSITMKLVPSIIVILVTLITFHTEINLLIPNTYYFTIIQENYYLILKLITSLILLVLELLLFPNYLELRKRGK